MTPAEQRRGPLHRRRVQRGGQHIDPAPLEHTGRFAVPDAVEIGLAHGAQARVKARLRLLQRERADVLRQMLPQGAQQLLTAERRLGQLDLLPEQPPQQPLEPGLQRVRGVPLPLPAAVARALIAQRELEIPHDPPLPFPNSLPDPSDFRKPRLCKCHSFPVEKLSALWKKQAFFFVEELTIS